MRILKPLPGTLPMPGHLLADAVALWPMNSLGNKVFDLSGNNNIGTFGAGAASPSWIDGKFGYELRFIAGNSQRVTIPDKDLFTFAGDFSLVTYVLHNISGGNQPLLNKSGGAGNREWQLGINTAQAQEIAFVIGNAAGNWDLVMRRGGTLSAGYHLIVGTLQGTTATIYLDGIQQGATGVYGGGNLKNTAQAVELGKATTSYLSGRMCFSMIYPRALSLFETAQISREPFCMYPEMIMAELGIVA